MGEQRLREQSCKEGVLLEIVFLREYNSLGLVLSLGLGVQRVTFGAGWSARPRRLAGWQNWFRLVEFQSLGRTFGCREKQGETANKDNNNGGSTSYLQVFSSGIMANSVK